MSYPPVLDLDHRRIGGGGGGGGGCWVSVGLFCPVVRLSHEEFQTSYRNVHSDNGK